MLDLRKLLLMVEEKKEMNAKLSLEFDCILEVDDAKPLVKVINYSINYLTPLTDKPIQISLNAQRDGYMLSFAVFTEKTELPALSDQLDDALKPYNASVELTHEQGKFVQIMIIFA